ncbi:MAG: hypothetical protein WC661_06575 [Opitutaceae bacterium]
MNTQSHLFRGILTVFFLTATPCAFALDFRILNWDGNDLDLKYQHKSEKISLYTFEGALSPFYHYSEAKPLTLFKEKMIKEEVVKVPAMTTEVPAGLTQAILLIVPTSPDRSSYTALWIDDSPLIRPAGTLEFRNLSKHSVALQVAGQEMNLVPQAVQQLKFDPALKRVAFKAAVQIGAEWKLVTANPVPVRPNYRALIILRDARPSETAAVQIISFYDRPPTVDELAVLPPQ